MSGRTIAFALAALIVTQRAAFAEEGVEARAGKVCAGMMEQSTNFQGALKIDNLTVQGDGNGTYTLKRNGADLGKFEKPTFEKYVDCLVQVMNAISPKTESKPSRPTQ